MQRRGLARQAHRAMNQFATQNVEFDIEDDGLINDHAARDRIAQAIAIVKKANPSQ
jgi:hypothetical protein